MLKESLSKTRLAIIQLECPEFTVSELRFLEDEKSSGKPSRKRSFWHIPEVGERIFQYICDFTPHQTYFYHMFKLAERDSTIDPDTNLNVPSAILTSKDYDYWCKADYWNTPEFIGLMIGRQPSQMRNYLQEIRSPTSELSANAHSLERLLDRSMEKRILDDRPSPRSLLAWAKSKQIDIPELLLSAAEKHDLFKDEDEAQDSSFYPDVYEDSKIFKMPNAGNLPIGNKGLSTKEKESLLKMVIGMGIVGYAYDPEKRRNPTAKEISDDLNKNGLSLDEDTIRKYLKAGAELLPREFKPNSLRKTNSGTA